MGLISLLITLLVCVVMSFCTIKKPSVTIGFIKCKGRPWQADSYYLIACLLPLVLLLIGSLSLEDVYRGITAPRAVNPLKILVLFFSMCFLSVCLDKAGFFELCAAKTLQKAKKGPLTLFNYFYFFIGLLTVFTSNDTIILAFTPFIYYFCKNAHIPAAPFIAAEFAAANTFSIMLIIGNPTNIYIATSRGIDFFGYLRVMAAPALTAGVTAYLVLRLIFSATLRSRTMTPQANLNVGLKNKSAALLSLAALSLCLITMSVSSFLAIEMWLVSLFFAGTLALALAVLQSVQQKRHLPAAPILSPALQGLPYGLVPFLLSMFVGVLSLEKHGITGAIADILLRGGGELSGILLFGFVSAAASNILNNIPMSVLFSAVLASADAPVSVAYATVIGSNIGAFISPTGALAGMMLLRLLKDKDADFRASAFLRYLAPAALASLAASLVTLRLCL